MYHFCSVCPFPPCAMICYPTFSSCRDCLHYQPNCAGLWMLYSCGSCQNDHFFLDLEGRYLHLAVHTGVVRSASHGLKQVHPVSWTRMCCRLEIQDANDFCFVLFLFLGSLVVPVGVIAHCYGHILYSIELKWRVSWRLWMLLPQTMQGRKVHVEESHTLSYSWHSSQGLPTW